MAWQFAGHDREARENVARRVNAISFFALAAYVTVESMRSIVGGAEAEHFSVGMVLASMSFAVMLGCRTRSAGRV